MAEISKHTDIFCTELQETCDKDIQKTKDAANHAQIFVQAILEMNKDNIIQPKIEVLPGDVNLYWPTRAVFIDHKGEVLVKHKRYCGEWSRCKCPEIKHYNNIQEALDNLKGVFFGTTNTGFVHQFKMPEYLRFVLAPLWNKLTVVQESDTKLIITYKAIKIVVDNDIVVQVFLDNRLIFYSNYCSECTNANLLCGVIWYM